jgi:hypothetical protein
LSQVENLLNLHTFACTRCNDQSAEERRANARKATTAKEKSATSISPKRPKQKLQRKMQKTKIEAGHDTELDMQIFQLLVYFNME